MERARATGAEEAPGLGGGVGEAKQKTIRSSPILKVMVPVGTWITAPVVARNGLPKIREARKSSSMSRIMKSQGPGTCLPELEHPPEYL